MPAEKFVVVGGVLGVAVLGVGLGILVGGPPPGEDPGRRRVPAEAPAGAARARARPPATPGRRPVGAGRAAARPAERAADAEWARFPRTSFDPVVVVVASAERIPAERLYRNRTLNPRDRVLPAGQRSWIAGLVTSYRVRLAELRKSMGRARREEILRALDAGRLPRAAPAAAGALVRAREEGLGHYRRLLRARARRHPEQAAEVERMLARVGPDDVVPLTGRPDLGGGDSLVVVSGRGRFVAPRRLLPRTAELEQEYDFWARELVALLATRYHALGALTAGEYRHLLARLYPDTATEERR